MSNSISRADFCRLSLTGLLGAACQRNQGPRPEAGAKQSSAAAAKPAPSAPPSSTAVPQRKLGSTGGKHELFKTSDKYDGTAKNPHWLEEARL